MINENGKIVLERKEDLEMLIRIDERTKSIDEKVNRISEKIKDYTEVRTDVMWLKRFFWILSTGVIGSLLAQIMQVVMIK